MEVQAPKRDRPAEAVFSRESPAVLERKKREYAEAVAVWEKELEEARGKPPPDILALRAAEFRESWCMLWSERCGDFEDTTKIPSMRFTDTRPLPATAGVKETLQVFSVRVVKLTGGLQWPLHVFGTVALRDPVDRNRNVIFHRKRDNCQILTQENPNLALTGPSRAVVILDPVTFEVELTVKGITESEDICLSYLAPHIVKANPLPLRSSLVVRNYRSKLSTVEFTYCHVSYSLEATVSVRVISGSWSYYRCEFLTRTASIPEDVLLLDSGNKEVPVTGDGKIELSREVVSVERKGQLTVLVKAWHGGSDIVHDEKLFTPKQAGRSHGTLDVGFCKMSVTVAWSLLSTRK